MLDRIVPSKIIRPLVPRFIATRFNGRMERALMAADTIMAGRDEKALSQRSALLVFSIRILSALIAYVSQVLLARWLGGHEYGIFVWVWVAAVIVGGLACVGFPSAVVRFVPEYRISGDMASLRGIVFGSRVYSVLAATGIAAIAMMVLWLAGDAVSSVYVVPLFVGVVCLPMLALSDVQEGVARSFNWMSLALSPKFLLRPALILLAMVLALAIGMKPTAVTALQATVVATWVTSLGQMLLLDRKIARELEPGPRQMRPLTWITVALPIFLVEGFYVLLTNVDILIAGIFLSPDKVAVYFAAVKTLALVHFVYYAVRAASAHRYSHFYNAGDPARYQAFVRDTVQWTFWPSLAMGFVILIFGKFLLMLFGPEFAVGYPLLFILVIGIVARAAVGPAESVLTMSGQQNICAVVFALALMVNIILNISLIPIYGLPGAAWATTSAMIFEAAALYAISLRRLGLHMFVFSPSDGKAA